MENKPSVEGMADTAWRKELAPAGEMPFKKGYKAAYTELQSQLVQRDKEIEEYKKDLAEQIESTRVVMVKNSQLEKQRDHYKALAEAAENGIDEALFQCRRLMQYGSETVATAMIDELNKYQSLKTQTPDKLKTITHEQAMQDDFQVPNNVKLENKPSVGGEAWQSWEDDQKTNPNPVNPHAYTYGYKAAYKKLQSQLAAKEKEIEGLKEEGNEYSRNLKNAIERCGKLTNDVYQLEKQRDHYKALAEACEECLKWIPVRDIPPTEFHKLQALKTLNNGK